jgi:hypothetical protein
MKISLFALMASAVLIAPAAAKTSNVNAIAAVSHWAGTWDCLSGKDKYTETFTPVLNGKAMRVTVTGLYAADGTAVYDGARKAWFYTFVNADGSYASMMGPVSGSNIAFKQIFPAGITTENIRGISNTKYSSTFTTTVNHKKMSAAESCTKR